AERRGRGLLVRRGGGARRCVLGLARRGRLRPRGAPSSPTFGGAGILRYRSPMSDAPKFSPPPVGPEHRVLAKDVGTWDGDVVIRMPGAPPQTSRGVTVSRLVCGGLWLVMDFHNETTGFDGHGLFGY